MSELPTLEEFRSHVDTHLGLFDPHGELTKTQDRTHAFSILAGAFVNSFHGKIARVLNERTISGVDPLRRTVQTLGILDEIEYGEETTAVSAAQRLWRIHSHATATMDNGTTVSATDPDLLAVALISGLRCSAALQILEHSKSLHDVDDRIQGLFNAYWAERRGLMASVGIPSEYLPESPDEAINWWTGQLRENLIADAGQNTLERILDAFASTASGQVADLKTRINSELASGIVIREVRTIAYYAAPPFLRAIAWPDGPPRLGHAALLTLPVANRVLPDWLSGGFPRECPEARRVMLVMADESPNT
jgi:uncharacterized protein (DUF2236 family)